MAKDAVLRLKDWPPDERPRERLHARGVEILSDAELIAVLIGSGSRGATALDLARRMLSETGGVAGLARCRPERLARFPGMGAAKAARVIAACELGRRRRDDTNSETEAVTDSSRAAALVSARLRDCGEERFLAVFLDVRHRPMKIEEVARGGWTQTQVDPRVLFGRALEIGASALIVAHNHPSGDPRHSPDHLVVGNGRWTSLADLGGMPS